jgi:hypothetical protein
MASGPVVGWFDGLDLHPLQRTQRGADRLDFLSVVFFSFSACLMTARTVAKSLITVLRVSLIFSICSTASLSGESWFFFADMVFLSSVGVVTGGAADGSLAAAAPAGAGGVVGLPLPRGMTISLRPGAVNRIGSVSE